MKRLFIGIPIESEKAVHQVDIWKNDRYLNRNVLNWATPGNWHITLFFLGSADESVVPMLQQLIEESFGEVKAYNSELRGVGIFPNTYNPKVLWIGFGDLQPLMPAYSRLGGLLLQNGFSFDQKPLKPHLTLARIKYMADRSMIDTLVNDHGQTVFDRVNINRIVLFESLSTPQGPVYNPLYVNEFIR